MTRVENWDSIKDVCLYTKQKRMRKQSFDPSHQSIWIVYWLPEVLSVGFAFAQSKWILEALYSSFVIIIDSLLNYFKAKTCLHLNVKTPRRILHSAQHWSQFWDRDRVDIKQNAYVGPICRIVDWGSSDKARLVCLNSSKLLGCAVSETNISQHSCNIISKLREIVFCY